MRGKPTSADDFFNVDDGWIYLPDDFLEIRIRSNQHDDKRRNRERDDEVIRLKLADPKRTAGQIANLIRTNPKWAIMQNDKPITTGAVRAILSRAKKAGKLPRS